MGWFDYTCGCGGKTCKHVGGQHQCSHVIIKAPLSDGTTVYLEGYYEQYGYVIIHDKYFFYPEEFRDYFDNWFRGEHDNDQGTNFIATAVWTVYEQDVNNYSQTVVRDCYNLGIKLVKLTQDILTKCIRADQDLDISTDKKKIAKEVGESVIILL